MIIKKTQICNFVFQQTEYYLMKLVFFSLLITFLFGCNGSETKSTLMEPALGSEQSIKSENVSDNLEVDYTLDSVIGIWKGDWYKGDRIELVLNSGIYFRRNYYTIDTIVSYELEIRDTNGILSYVNKDEPSLEYYRIEDNGNLGRYSKWLKVEEIEKLDQK